MIVDTSVIIAILQDEPESERFSAILADSAPEMSAATLLELGVVAHGRGPGKAALVQRLLTRFEVGIVPVDEQQARLGLDAYARYGRGSGHPARLNYGDCFSYALAISRDQPLLFKGDDFSQTDVRVADAALDF